MQRARYIGMIRANECIHNSGMEKFWKKVTWKIKSLIIDLFNDAFQLFLLCRMICKNDELKSMTLWLV
jgi:hypothetical protein